MAAVDRPPQLPEVHGPVRRGSYPIQRPPVRDRNSIFTNPFASQGQQPPQLSPQSVPDTIRAVNGGTRRCNDSHVTSPSVSNPNPRTIVICLDGTGDQFDNDNSNVVRFVQCLRKDSPDQITFYQSGIGTYKSGHHVQDGISAAVDMAVGSGLGLHVRGAYRFLQQNYRENDRICLFGFSRGAYTVRSLAGMLHKVGLLPPHNTEQVSFAYRYFKDDTPEGWKMSAEFKKTFCTDVDVHFVGVWDCVASVGFVPRTLPFSKSSNNSIRHFRHALALDEHRAKFKACHWVQRHETADRLRLHRDTMQGVVAEPEQINGVNGAASPREPGQTTPNGNGVGRRASMVRSLVGSVSRRNSSIATTTTAPTTLNLDGGGGGVGAGQHSRRASSMVLESLENEDRRDLDSDERKQAMLETTFEEITAMEGEDKDRFETDVEEVWFLGAHADVGGGAVPNETRHQLARIPLRWMIRCCFDCDTNILFRTEALAEMGLDVETLYPVYRKRQVPIVLEPEPRILERYRTRTLPSLLQRAQSIRSRTLPSRQPSPFFPSPLPSPALTMGPGKGETDVPEAYLKEANEDYFDALAPINDQLEESRAWWILEAWPVKVRIQNKDDNGWTKRVAMNRGRYRAVRAEEPQMHYTVKLRMDTTKYKPQVRMAREAAWKVVT
ncbi:uncharacterized protein PFL1_00367 [Pseudozyma flocculosa PF-1]|uniref:T6SS Phospholipase effector Tle1-like catalytic domain-containing protein n=1 Tax=Pseudozyma flocculosa TaxID=84751 RepID=A0A5C3ERN1_9BASI|nr:uncharacterized protein PFL1_00367 [Pseudozyma flocculosa PF-1]EPQ32170.1 hypothetical protein PFL1_00367 [Pseudozyma flocculosa PF-1]SPO34888.1 uncharacterized protein PSFLO_00359 [Pseudozyma flocculosa]